MKCERFVAFRTRNELEEEDEFVFDLQSGGDVIERLNAVAKEGKFWSYVSGTVLEVYKKYGLIGGLCVDITKCDLPVKKGLSSSAAICVCVARAFSVAYNEIDRISVREQMELAYLGERNTPSMCGRMDQACAFGSGSCVSMTFDGDDMECAPVIVGREKIFIVVCDVEGEKDTVRILEDLQSAYPFARTEREREAQKFLGDISLSFVSRAKTAIQSNKDAARELGKTFAEYQKEFDRCLQPLCESELAAPKLHALLNDPKVKIYSYGGKGVGSQGDGSAQFVCRDEFQASALEKHLRNVWKLSHVLRVALNPSTVFP